jgi:hypothetical protein
MIAWILIIAILAFVGKLIYDVQQNKNKINEINESALTEALKFREQWQTIAGIKPHNKEAAPFNPHNNKLNENIIDELKRDFQNSKFPPESESIPVQSFPITKIKFNGDSDPLGDVPMSRVSNEGKKKMAEIAKEDINKQVEKNAERLSTLQPINLDEPKKPKRKYNKKPKQ